MVFVEDMPAGLFSKSLGGPYFKENRAVLTITWLRSKWRESFGEQFNLEPI
jgi:hypothetical protein